MISIRNLQSPLGCLFALAFAAHGAGATERWTDRGLPVATGLELWLDATTLDLAVRDRAAGPLRDGDALNAWPEGSGHHRDISAPATPARPVYRSGFPEAATGPPVVRFDGNAALLAIKNLALRLDDFTVFIVAAPRSNAGGFRGLLSVNAAGQNDYRTGFNVDLGAGSSIDFSTLNVEGNGFGGEQNLLRDSVPFDTFHVLTVTSRVGPDGVKLFDNGELRGQRNRSPGTIVADELHVGGRHYSNTSAPTFDQGFFDGAVAEVLLYRQALTEPQRQQVERYLTAKYAAFLRLKGQTPGEIIHMVVPGFTVRELPVHLPNVNYLCYAPDGRLFALGYDGRVHVLRDTDGDGLEDRVDPFWYQPTLKVPVSMLWAPEGLYVTSSRKLSLLRDTDGDGVADVEEVIAKDWVLPDDPSHGGGVDCMAVAKDAEGNIYFGLGCADYTNPYRVWNGQPHYDIHSERGTIIKLSPDHKHREIFCTGIRFPYSLNFNRYGDLFCTDQEGATWLPNGNPLDELDHIIQGRHYGFPYRHAAYLPNVADDPPVVAFGPQHQSTCGMVFNEAAPRQKSFGPELWEGDALVAGYSRGKLWRAKLAKTPTDYVGKETLLAVSRMLLLDIAVSPGGALAVACHSGGPDWGSGPHGPGKLFKIFYDDHAAPQPVTAWAASPIEVRVAFDRPLVAAVTRQATNASISYGQYVRAADRLEVLHPPYKVVGEQLRSFVGKLKIAAARLSTDRRTLILSTDPHPFRATYALTWPGIGARQETIDLGYDLSGVAASWASGAPGLGRRWSGWLPHFDPDVVRRMTTDSTDHERFLKLLEAPGALTLQSRLLLPATNSTVSVHANQPFTVALAGNETKAANDGHERYLAKLAVDPPAEPIEFVMSIRTGGNSQPLQLHLSYHTIVDPTERPLQFGQSLVPWAGGPPPGLAPDTSPSPEIVGGNYERGRAIFFGEKTRCSTCHTIRGEGGKVGPDLSNLIHRDAASVRRDILEPSVTINPDYVSYTVKLKDGSELSGILRTEGADRLRVINAANTDGVLIRRDDAVEMRPDRLSIMPQGLDAAIGPGGMKDLLTFLLLPPATSADAAKSPDAAGTRPR
jgi:putative heme-binding domain-containing protein